MNGYETPSHTELLNMGFICLVFDRRYLRETLRLMRVRDRGCKTLDVERSNEQSGRRAPPQTCPRPKASLTQHAAIGFSERDPSGNIYLKVSVF